MQLHQLQRHTKLKTSTRVARGGTRGKTAGRGTKGQNSRAGGKVRPEIRDQIKRYPKLRGYKFNSTETKPSPVNLSDLELGFAVGEAVTVEALLVKRLVRRVGGKLPKVKILGTGTLNKKLTVTGCTVSATAKTKIEAVGGTVTA